MAMSIQIEAIYENGVFRPLQAVALAEHQRVTVIMDANAPPGSLPFHPDHPPLRVDEWGAVRVANSRIRLGLVVEQYENGMTPEDMVRAYDTLLLADVHAVIAYYLRNRDEVRAYLKRRGEEADALRAKIEAERPRISRQELLARGNVLENADAPAGQ
jgi:uncharacterized protein (DUF433 family)